MSDKKTTQMIEYTVEVSPNGTQYWYLNGVFHREGNKPSLVFPDGEQRWYINGKLHREDGPAIVYSNRSNRRPSWFLNGKGLTEEEFNNRNKIELTLEDLEEISKKFNIPLDKLMIKNK